MLAHGIVVVSPSQPCLETHINLGTANGCVALTNSSSSFSSHPRCYDTRLKTRLQQIPGEVNQDKHIHPRPQELEAPNHDWLSVLRSLQQQQSWQLGLNKPRGIR